MCRSRYAWLWGVAASAGRCYGAGAGMGVCASCADLLCSVQECRACQRGHAFHRLAAAERRPHTAATVGGATCLREPLYSAQTKPGRFCSRIVLCECDMSGLCSCMSSICVDRCVNVHWHMRHLQIRRLYIWRVPGVAMPCLSRCGKQMRLSRCNRRALTQKMCVPVVRLTHPAHPERQSVRPPGLLR